MMPPVARCLAVMGAAIMAAATLAGVAMAQPLPATQHVSRPLQLAGSVPRTHGPTSMRVVKYETSEPSGTVIVSNSDRTLHLVLGNGLAEQYTISIGREGFTWTGVTRIGRKAEWPDWRPPAEMRQREPSLPDIVPAGPMNPLGARAIYLHKGQKDTLYRIHGTNDAATVGQHQTSGCFRLSNSDVLALYDKVKVGAKVIVK
jgi:lipoprotein-anchoring transpeptidase ErfK/SrfK